MFLQLKKILSYIMRNCGYLFLLPKFGFRYFDSKNHYFIGYHDINPFNQDSRYIACLRTSEITPANPQKRKADVVLLDVVKPWKQPIKITETTAWDSQIASRQQWSPVKDHLWYNVYNKSELQAECFDIFSKKILKKLNGSLFSISPDGTLGVTVNLKRLYQLRPGYGFPSPANESRTQKNVIPEKEDGLWLINLLSGNYSQVLKISDLRKYKPLVWPPDVTHYVNIPLFNPTSTSITFLHVWQNDIIKRTRLLDYDLTNQKLNIISQNNISHFCYLKNNQLIYFDTTAHKNGKAGYNLNTIDNDLKIENLSKLPDGHPNYNMKMHAILIDTYPNLFGLQKLFFFSCKHNTLKVLGKEYRPMWAKGHYKCDFHPRFNAQGNIIAADTLYKGKRSINIIPLTNELVRRLY